MEGNLNRKIRVMTQMIFEEAKKNMEERKEPKLTVGQHNAIFEAIQKVLDGNV